MALVYVLDDDQVLGHTIRNLVHSLGHQCEYFDNSASFIAATKRTAPGAFLIDMWLGSTTALEVTAQHADLLEGIPAIMMSGGNGNASLEKVTAIADAEGFRDVLYKPFERDELQAVFAKHIKSDVS